MNPRDSHAGMHTSHGCGCFFPLDSDPVAPSAPPVPGRELQDWHPDDWQSLLTTAATLAGYVADVPAGHWWPAFLLTQWDTSARFDDLLTVRKQDVDLFARALDCGPHVYRLHPLTVSALQPLIDGSDAMLFPWPREEQCAGNLLTREVRRLAERTGLAVCRHKTAPDRRLASAARRVPGLLDRLTLPASSAASATPEDADGIYDPSPDEIAAACAAIRSTWSDDEYLARARGRSRSSLNGPGDEFESRLAPRWSVPVCQSAGKGEPCC